MERELPIRITEETAGDEASPPPKAKRKFVHRDSEKRRLQNLQAQKKYRERRKKRLQELESIAASAEKADTTDADGLSASNTVPPLEDPPAIDFQDVEDIVRAPDSPSTALPQQTAPGELIWFSGEWAWSPAFDGQPIDAGSWHMANFHCGCAVPHIHIRMPNVIAAHAARRVAALSYFPDPLMNRLRIERVCIVEAMRLNCLQIGITDEMFCSDDGISGFYRPGLERGTDFALETVAEVMPGSLNNESLVKSVQSIFRTLKPDLQPLREQITTSHHPFIDILPFPTVRRNLVRNGPLLDEDDFFYDLLNGVMCWGGAGTTSRRERASAGANLGSGTPWDSRSWEASEWFLEKWWSIVGGEEGELTRQSRWWRSLRGEDIEQNLLR